MNWFLVAIGGAIGSLMRYGLSVILPVATGQFPWATWWANILGCSLAGIFLALSEHIAFLQGQGRLLLLVGVLGGFTTFSSFSLETFNMLRHAHINLAVTYIISSWLFGLLSLASAYYCLKFVIEF